jgi:hypothetical protein
MDLSLSAWWPGGRVQQKALLLNTTTVTIHSRMCAVYKSKHWHTIWSHTFTHWIRCGWSSGKNKASTAAINAPAARYTARRVSVITYTYTHHTSRHIRTYIHAYIHTHIHTYIHTYIHTCIQRERDIHTHAMHCSTSVSSSIIIFFPLASARWHSLLKWVTWVSEWNSSSCCWVTSGARRKNCACVWLYTWRSESRIEDTREGFSGWLAIWWPKQSSLVG